MDNLINCYEFEQAIEWPARSPDYNTTGFTSKHKQQFIGKFQLGEKI